MEVVASVAAAATLVAGVPPDVEGDCCSLVGIELISLVLVFSAGLVFFSWLVRTVLLFKLFLFSFWVAMLAYVLRGGEVNPSFFFASG